MLSFPWVHARLPHAGAAAAACTHAGLWVQQQGLGTPRTNPAIHICRVKEHCIQRGLTWDDSLAKASCTEQEYYEDLLRFYRYNHRVSIGFARQGPCCHVFA